MLGFVERMRFGTRGPVVEASFRVKEKVGVSGSHKDCLDGILLVGPYVSCHE